MSNSASRLFVALVTFERGSGDGGILRPHDQGASGWMGIRNCSEENVPEAVSNELSELGLRLVEIDKINEVDSAEAAATYDEHLSSNMAKWEAGTSTVWGTIHCYAADGEA